MTSKVVLGPLREAPKAAPEPIGSPKVIETKTKTQKMSSPPSAFDLIFNQNRKIIEKVCLEVAFVHVIFRISFLSDFYAM